MGDTFLVTAFADKDKVKALGAKWNPDLKKWFVPAGQDLAPFTSWLPIDAAEAAPGATHSIAVLAPKPQAIAELTSATRGIALSRLLAQVSRAVSQAFSEGVWTTVEVIDARLRNGHVYMEVSERDASGAVLAKANASIWAQTANQILPPFEQATGAKIGPGIKLLVKARPVFKAQFGFSLEIEAIDPQYTLGDLEAKKREIRARLQREGLFDANRQLASAWDYRLVWVVAPQDGAGLGDFQAEAQRLEQFGICKFQYAYSRFQGEGSAAEIRSALLAAMARWGSGERGDDGSGPLMPDAVVILRGGGAVNDLAWLNDYDLARCICEMTIPVLTGIGHERDSTILDEVANQKFDTPSKVIAGIEQVIAKRAAEAKEHFVSLTHSAHRAAQASRRNIEQFSTAVKTGSQRHVAIARQGAHELVSDVRLNSLQSIKDATERVSHGINAVCHQAQRQVNGAKTAVPAYLAEVQSQSRQLIGNARFHSKRDVQTVLDRVAQDVHRANDMVQRQLADVSLGAKRMVTEAAVASQALVREITGQGPEKTLGRGFTLVKSMDGKAITQAAQIAPEQDITIEFRDGTVRAKTI